MDPKCMFWNVSSGSWDERGVDTVQVGNVDTGEIKSYDVKCTAGHATAFAVILDVNTEVFFTCSLQIMSSYSYRNLTLRFQCMLVVE